MHFALFAALVAMTAPTIAAPQPVIGFTTTGQPTTVTLSGQNAQVDGFRSAAWGMTPDQVRAALAKDFGGTTAGPLIVDPVGGTKAMIAPMSTLAPGPGKAAITYIFGATSGRLVHVNLDWVDRRPTPATRTALLAGGTKVVGGFSGSYWKIGSVVRGVVAERDLIILFAGADDRGGAVDVRVRGIPYALKAGAGAEAVTAPGGPAELHVGFSAPDSASDVRAIPPGAF